MRADLKPRHWAFYSLSILPLAPGFFLLLTRSPGLLTWVLVVSGIALAVSWTLSLSVRNLRATYMVLQYASLVEFTSRDEDAG